MSTENNHNVIRYLLKHSKYPLVSSILLATCYEHLHVDTGEILLNIDEIANCLEQNPSTISAIMLEMEECGAIIRQYQKLPGMQDRDWIRYFLNPLIATYLDDEERDKAQEKAPKLRLVKVVAATTEMARLNNHAELVSAPYIRL
jgi:hypothetical protein